MSTLSSTKRYLGHVAVAFVAVQGFMLPVLAHSRGAITVSAPVATAIVPTVLPQPTAIAQVQPKPRRRFISQVASRLSGIASWYGKALHGHPTASGEIFDESALTACHRTLPFGTKVKVTNTKNHLSVIVRITDRGVLNPERVIDLSSAAADKIGMLRAGVAPVKLTIVPSNAMIDGE